MLQTLRRSFFACSLLFSLALVAPGCDLFEDDEDTSRPIVPQTFQGRDVEIQGTAYVESPSVTFNVWDSGSIDGDIISLYVNGRKVIDTMTLTASKRSVTVRLNPKGYSYVMLYAHNEGAYSPNTAAVSIDDGVSEETLVLSADLLTNAAYNIVVR